MSVDLQEGPIAAQAWQIFNTLRGTVQQAGGTLDDIVHLAQYFTDIRDFPIYSRVRDKFFTSPPASTCLEVSGTLPSKTMRLEIQAVAHIPTT
jgi:enamine deaminase RidA (YjgF/YER057c/UK114 family)